MIHPVPENYARTVRPCRPYGPCACYPVGQYGSLYLCVVGWFKHIEPYEGVCVCGGGGPRILNRMRVYVNVCARWGGSSLLNHVRCMWVYVGVCVWCGGSIIMNHTMVYVNVCVGWGWFKSIEPYDGVCVCGCVGAVQIY